MTVSELSCFSVLHAPEPVCRKIPHEICKQVSKTRYESVIRKECHSVPDNVCAELQERKCSFTQRPVQENVDTNFICYLGCVGHEIILFRPKLYDPFPPDLFIHTNQYQSKSRILIDFMSTLIQENVPRKECRIHYKKDCKTEQNIRKQCLTEQAEKCHNVPDLQCENIPRKIVDKINEEQCTNEYQEVCTTNHELKCEPVIENKCTNGGTEAYCKVVNGTTCSTVHDEVCEDVVSKECHDIYENKCTKVTKEVCKVSASGLH